MCVCVCVYVRIYVRVRTCNLLQILTRDSIHTLNLSESQNPSHMYMALLFPMTKSGTFEFNNHAVFERHCTDVIQHEEQGISNGIYTALKPLYCVCKLL